MDGLKVKATAVYVMNGKEGQRPYFQVGYAVAEDCRGQGVAQETLGASISEMSAGFENIIPEFQSRLLFLSPILPPCISHIRLSPEYQKRS